MVYGDGREMDGMVFGEVYVDVELGEVGLKVVFGGLEWFVDGGGGVRDSGLVEELEGGVEMGELLGEYVVDGLLGLGNVGKVVVCEDNGMGVVVVDF